MGSVSRVFKHFYKILFSRFGTRLPRTAPAGETNDARLFVASQVSSDPEQVTFSEQRTDSLPLEKIAPATIRDPEKALTLDES
jgi:hypothetical protein